MEFLIITGLSGAGKTRAADVLEDVDYYCVDNMPVALMTRFAKEDPDQNGVDDTYGMSVTAMKALFGAYGLGEEGFAGGGNGIFVVRDGILSTPPVSDGVLEGITRDTVLIANFRNLDGIDEAESSDILVKTRGLELCIENPAQRHIEVYDIMGRPISSLRTPLSTLTLPSAGVYMLKADGMPARRIIVTNR